MTVGGNTECVVDDAIELAEFPETADANPSVKLVSRVPNKTYGLWKQDEAGLPCFDGTFHGPAATERPFLHGFSSGRLNVLVNRWGLVHLFTTEGGYTDISANNSLVRSGLYLEWLPGDERFSLLHNDLIEKRSVRYGIGYARFEGIWKGPLSESIELTQEFFTPPDRLARMGGAFTLKNTGLLPLKGRIRVRSDIELKGTSSSSRRLSQSPGATRWKDARADLGDIFLISDPELHGVTEGGVALMLERALELAPGEELSFNVQVGYGTTIEPLPTAEESRLKWRRKLEALTLEGSDLWVKEEAVWSFGQLYSFAAYDSSVDEFYLNLGGYGWPGFGVREVPETAMTVAAWDADLALSCLRWTAKLQYKNGNLPHCHAFRRAPLGETLDTGHEESDNEIWFLLACAHVARTIGSLDFLEEPLPYWDGGSGTLLDHIKHAVTWIKEGIGVGSHGLIRIAEGDWNDYLSGVGRLGHGESMLNTGMACCALQTLIPLVRSRDPKFATECIGFLRALREAAQKGFDEKWFVRGYTDQGAPFGTAKEGRLFLNAQSWCVLGGCGTLEMRQTAMRSALELCWSPIGLTLMSRPYSCPPPPEVSSCPIPAGEGENAGIWPQTVHWAIWALAELGWKEEGLAVWKRMSLRNHSTLFPETPYGIFNGPDCYSSHFAGEREGWTQVEMLERAKFPPMNPMVAWQAFSLRQLRTN